MTKTLQSLFALALLTFSSAAVAQEEPDVDVGLSMESLPELTFDVERFPPSVSYEFGMHFSLGTLSYWEDYLPGWIGFGARFGAGKHFGNHRIGGLLTGVVEGPIGVYTSFAAEPHVTWDHVGNNNIQVGFGAGPALMYHVRADTIVGERAVTVNPSVAARFGWSQTWTKVGRRMYLLAEPKVRMINGTPNVVGALVVGSGGGS